MLNERAETAVFSTAETVSSNTKVRSLAVSNGAAAAAAAMAKRQPLIVNKILSALPERELERLKVCLQPVNFADGETVHQPDDYGKFIYFPETAVFAQLNILQDGRTVETAMIGSEGVTGITTALEDRSTPIPWTQVLTGGTALRISVSIFRQEFVANKHLQTAVFDYLKNYIEQISRKTVCNQHHLIEEKFATWLLMLDDRREANKLVLTHEQIARHLGVHRPSVSCVAQTMRDKKIIAYSRGHISIINRQNLLAAACECYHDQA